MHRSARDGCEVAPAGLLALLAIDLEAWSRATSDLPGAAGTYPTIRDGKRLGSKEGPIRAREARVPGFAGDGVALPAKEEAE